MTRHRGHYDVTQRMNTTPYSSERKMSFSLWAMACGVISKGLADTRVRQARMHPQSTGGPVLRLRSRRALSPVPLKQFELTGSACHCKIQLRGQSRLLANTI